MNLPKRQTLLIIFCSLFSAFLLSGCGKKAEQTTTRPKIQEPVNTVPVSDRPYATLGITRAGKYPLGREVELVVYDNKGAEKIEYELEYQAGTSVQAGLGSFFSQSEKLPYRKSVLLGSCSAGGACSYHEDVKGGTILLRLKNSSVGNVKGEWNYYKTDNGGKVSSKDGKFQVVAPKLNGSYAVVTQTMGLPKAITTDLLAGPYHIDSNAKTVGNMDLTMILSEEAVKPKLLFWDGKAYKESKNSVDGKTLKATVTSLGTYLVVK